MSTDKGASGGVDQSISMQDQLLELAKLMEMQIKSSLQNTPTMGGSLHDVRNVKAPEGRYDMNSAEFRMYAKDCRDYKALTNCKDTQLVIQMRLGMDTEMKRAIDTNFGEEWNTFTLDKALASVKELLKCNSNTAIFRKEFDSIFQKNGESIREFITRLKACALDCEFCCPFDQTHDLTEYHIVNRVRCGVLDKQLQQELLQKSGDIKSLESITNYCENFESAKEDRDRLRSDVSTVCGIETEDLTEEEVVAAISSYKRNKQNNKGKCGKCGFEKHDKSRCPAQGKKCVKCNKMNHFANQCRTRQQEGSTTADAAAVIVSSITKIENIDISTITQLPQIKVSVSCKGRKNAIEVVGIADTGAQACVAGNKHMKLLNLNICDLEKPKHELKHVGGNYLEVIGSRRVVLSLNGQCVDTELFFIKGIPNFYLSLDVCKGLHLVHNDFPYGNVNSGQMEVSSIKKHAQAGTFTRPTKLPYEPNEKNIPLLKKWLLDHFSESVFNIDVDILPVMKGTPHSIHLKNDAIPYAAHTPIPVPYHWKEAVKSQLDNDEKHGIIRKAPVGEASEWCMRMVTVPKNDGTPRRTIDFQPINKYCAREAHYTPTPFNAVSSLPTNVYKTTLDAYNGYHQVELDKDSVKYTTFITEFGRYQYLRAPQGHISSGDAYVRRFDEIISKVDRKIKIVDDVLLYDFSIEEGFFHTFDFLCLCALNGVTLNPPKFNFSQKRVDFVGFDIDWDNFKPSSSTMSAIKDFPMPDEPKLVDIRSWYGLVNQVAPFITLSPIMAPFRDLLKSTKTSGNKVYWDNELKKIFEDTKEKLCQLMTEGLSFYDVSKRTCVITDWCRTGIGFIIMQKHCKCSKEEPLSCCMKGWKLAYCKSRHLDEMEQNYMPIEGEALDIDWALQRGRLYLLGNEFELLTDQKPLVKIFNDKPLHEIENLLIQKFKERSMSYSFKVNYIKGIKNKAGDALSRYPANNPDETDSSLTKELAAITIVSIDKNISNVAITTSDVRLQAMEDDQYKVLLDTISHPLSKDMDIKKNPNLKEFHSVSDRLCICDGLIMYGFEGNPLRIFIPKNMRKQVIANLHSANQGSTSMLSRARQSVYWPGMDQEINLHCKECLACRSVAPSLTKEPLQPSNIPQYPFQYVASDMFDIDGYMYLVYVDHLTGFPELAYFPRSTTSTLLINVFREFFMRWGVPEEISLDGAPNYSSLEMKEWLKSWGVEVRSSSAYFPQSNGRAEAGVKSMKRLLMGNLGPKGSIDNDRVAKALMQYRNTPLRDGGASPAQLAIGRHIRDTLPLPQQRYRIDPNWARMLHEREVSMAKRNEISKNNFDEGSKPLRNLAIGDTVLCQNNKTKKWDRVACIVEFKGYRQYVVKLAGSGRLSLRNRRHLQPVSEQCFLPFATKNSSKIVSTHEPVMEETKTSKNELDQGAGLTIGKDNQLPQVIRRSTRVKKPTQRYITEC